MVLLVGYWVFVFPRLRKARNRRSVPDTRGQGASVIRDRFDELECPTCHSKILDDKPGPVTCYACGSSIRE
jgi:hypothetical protein